jgi:hypothetical protein
MAVPAPSFGVDLLRIDSPPVSVNETSTSTRKLPPHDGDAQCDLHERKFVRHLLRTRPQGSCWGDCRQAIERRGSPPEISQTRAAAVKSHIKKVSCWKFNASPFRGRWGFQRAFIALPGDGQGSEYVEKAFTERVPKGRTTTFR